MHQLNKPLRLLLLGAPGSGKGTLTKRLTKRLPNIGSISSGDLLRQEIKLNTELGKTVESYIKQGKLVPDNLITKLVSDHILSLSETSQITISISNSWILDGFPRTVFQAKTLHELLLPKNKTLTKVIELDVPESAILDRILNRYVHVPSGRIYNLSYNPPKIPGKDDITGEPLVKRLDDNEITLINRLTEYKKMLAPLREYYKSRGLLSVVTGETSDIIFPQLTKALEE